MTERLGDQPIEKKHVEMMNIIARTLDKLFNGDAKGTDRKVGFILMVFNMNDTEEGRCNYISNGADRKDVVVLMKETIKRFEGQAEVKGTA